MFSFSFISYAVCLSLPIHGKAQSWFVPRGMAKSERDHHTNIGSAH